MKESLKGIDKNLIFRETFNSEFDLRRNGGVPVDVTFSDGVGGFDGMTSYVDVGQGHSPIITATGNWTITTFIKISDISVNGSIFSQYLASAGNGRILFRIYNEKLYLLLGDVPPLSSVILESTQSLIPNEWYMVTIVRNSNIFKMYLNGSEVDSVIEGTVRTILQTKNLIGSYGDNASIYNSNLTGYLKGEINLLEIYNTALTAQEVSNLYNRLTYRDIREWLMFDLDVRRGVLQDSLNNTIVNIGVVVKKDTVDSAYFNGSEYLEIPSSVGDIGTEVRTFSFIVKFKDLTTENSIIGTRNNNSGGWILQISSSLIMFLNSKGIGTSFRCSYAFQIGIRYNIIVVRAGTAANAIYINGISQALVVNTENLDPTSGGITPVIGRQYESSVFKRYLYGYLNQLRIYNRALTANEATQLNTSQRRYYE